MNKIKWIEKLLALQIKNANEQLEGAELINALNLFILDYQNLLEWKEELSEDVRAVQESVRKDFNSLSE